MGLTEQTPFLPEAGVPQANAEQALAHLMPDEEPQEPQNGSTPPTELVSIKHSLKAASFAMELVEEQLSGAFLPERLDHNASQSPLLLCCGLRSKRIGFLDIQIYALGVYGNPEAIFGQGASFANDPVRALHESKADKVFSLTLLRNVTGAQISDGLGETLVKVAKVSKEEVDMITPFFPSKVAKGAELRLTVRPSVGELIIGDDEASRVVVPDLIRGLHELYFGAAPVIKGLPESLQRQQPWLQSLQEAEPEPELDAPSISFSIEEMEASEARQQPAGWLASIPSGDGLEHATDQGSSDATSSPQKSWKSASGRTGGKEGYKFGDLTRSLTKKFKKNRSDSGGGEVEQPTEGWPSSPLIVEASEENCPSWVTPQDVPYLDSAMLAEQSLKASFHKYHSTPLRGRLVPKWSLRHYELKAGVLQYQRKEGGKLVGSICLDGARVVAEPTKASRIGECFVFRIIVGAEVVARLSCTDRAVAAEWVVGAAAACAHFRACVRTPPVQECEQLASVESSQGNDVEVVKPSNTQTSSEAHSSQVAVRSKTLQSRVAALFRRCQSMDSRDWLRIILPLLLALFAVRRLRNRPMAVSR